MKNTTELFKEQMDSCFELMKSRNEKYWDSWKNLRVDSMIDLMSAKLERCKAQSLDNKAMEIELEDIVNYWIFALMKIRKPLWIINNK